MILVLYGNYVKVTVLRRYINYKILCELVNTPETIVTSIIPQLKKELVTCFRRIKLEWRERVLKTGI